MAERDSGPDLGPTSVDVIVPMLGRPHHVEAIVTSLIDSADPDVPFNLVFVVSKSDREVVAAVREAREEAVTVPWKPGPGDFAKKTNLAFREATYSPWVLLGASDLRFHPGWARAAVKVGLEANAGVVGTDDMGNPTVRRGLHSTHPVVNREYIDTVGGGWDGPGVVYHEGYRHQWVDTELVTAARQRGRWAFAHDSKVEHLHFLWGKSERDSTYDKALADGAYDAALFKSREASHR